ECCALRRLARDRFSAGCRLPWLDAGHRVPIQRHGFRFDSAGMMPDAALRILDMRGLFEPVANSVPPHNSVTGLIFKSAQYCLIALFVDLAAQCLPTSRKSLCFLRSVIV